jgi:hypothetical protein
LDDVKVRAALTAAADDLSIPQDTDPNNDHISVSHELIADPWIAADEGVDDVFYTIVGYDGVDPKDTDETISISAILAWVPSTGDCYVVGGIHTVDIFPNEQTTSAANWEHVNAFSPTHTQGLWMMHDRFRSDVALIDISKEKAEVLWHISNTDETQNDFTFVTDEAYWQGGHHLTMLSNGDLSLFDNECSRNCDDLLGESDSSRFLRVSVDTKAKTVAYVSDYDGISNPFVTQTDVMGSVYPIILGDADAEDHFLVAFPNAADEKSDISIVTADGESLLQTFSFPESFFYRAKPIPSLAVGERRWMGV